MDKYFVRKSIGFFSLSLPLVLLIGSLIVGINIKSSISDYYNSIFRDFFVGILYGLGTVMFVYSANGYERIDNILNKLSCLFAVGVAMFPVSVSKIIHTSCALSLFIIMIYMVLFLFTKTDKTIIDRKKKQRNIAYRILGTIMVVGLLSSPIMVPFKAYYLVFWLETLLVICFSLSWLIKGQLFLKD